MKSDNKKQGIKTTNQKTTLIENENREYLDETFTLKCTKPLDNMFDRSEKSHVIAFSPLGNGKYTKNIESGLTLQDDFVIMVYQELLKKEKVKELHKK